MINKVRILCLFFSMPIVALAQDACQILEKVDDNLAAENKIIESSMTIHGRRNSRTITSKTYIVEDKKSFTEYLSPARERGTKMLKLKDQLWTYYPANDRTIQISGHMLRQSVMGSDMSYEDMMDDRKLIDMYTPAVESKEELDGRQVFVLKLTAKVENTAYYSRKMWVDTERFVPLREELYAKSGKLLKRTVLSDVKNIDGRWYPMTINFKDMLKQGDGTDMKVISIQFNQDIPDYLFTKAALKQ
jgi:outer membrane lipoprotein-sorting protein